MRTTIDIEDDIYLYARQIASAERVAIGKIVSRMMRDSLRPAIALGVREQAQDQYGYVYKNGIPVIPADGRVITQELIDRIREDEGL